MEQLVREGKLTGYRLGGRFLRFRPTQVEGLKKSTRTEGTPALEAAVPGRSWGDRVKEFIYFYDFYIVSSSLLAMLVVYLVMST